MDSSTPSEIYHNSEGITLIGFCETQIANLPPFAISSFALLRRYLPLPHCLFTLLTHFSPLLNRLPTFAFGDIIFTHKITFAHSIFRSCKPPSEKKLSLTIRLSSDSSLSPSIDVRFAIMP